MFLPVLDLYSNLGWIALFYLSEGEMYEKCKEQKMETKW